MHASARQLDAIRSELRSGMRLMPPLPTGEAAVAAQHRPRSATAAPPPPPPSPSGRPLTPLPFSAVSVGRAPARAGAAPTGSDVLADALAEEEVARLAAQFMEGGAVVPRAGGAGPRPVPRAAEG